VFSASIPTDLSFLETNECSAMSSVTVSRFEQHVADLARNENEGFRRQFEVCALEGQMIGISALLRRALKN
jgi:hypothetical protein